MSYTCISAPEKLGRAEIDLATTTGFYLGLVLEGSALSGTGQPSATAMSAVTNLQECNYANYVKMNLTGLSLTIDSTAIEARFKFTPVVWTALGDSSTPVVGCFIQWGSSTTTGRPLWYFDNSPTFPLHGGRDVAIGSLSGGTVRLYG